MPNEPLFSIGIDLGTTNSVLAYVSLKDEEAQVQRLAIPQCVAPSTIEARTSLPSFAYLAPEAESESGEYDLPWLTQPRCIVGELARKKSADTPMRTVVAAKSWLCHHRVDRREPILPWNAPEELPKLSPVAASTQYLNHLVAAWEAAHPEAPIQDQQVVLTVPASFDASARELTREAAQQAGIPESMILLEEPQAALYAWLSDLGEKWRKRLTVDDIVLVCDIGGGTTDFTLIRVAEEDGNLELRRIAVGRHLLVGGDNMDLALSHFVAQQFQEKKVKLDPWQSVSLWHSCRFAKETLLGSEAPPSHPISVLGRGSRLIGGTVSLDLQQEDAVKMILDGFFPACSATAKPQRRRGSGFQEVGLPFEADPAITKHLASFLAIHGEEDAPIQPTHLLLNGGVFKSSSLRERLLAVLGNWSADGAEPENLTAAEDLDHAVARGAAYYGLAKEGKAIRIRGGTARAYYVGVETAGLAIPGAPRPLRAVCVVPHGMEEGTEVTVPSEEFGLIVGEPTQFRFFSSAIRKDDQPGQSLAQWGEEELEETDPLEATLTASPEWEDDYVPVRFETHLTELGQLELWCVSTISDERWKLEFSVREEDET
ncbi:Molecular chaperone DnaK [Planctomycetales bacterium 10988]|nr:Molecular chaperone DnaK [Planctomycetales bacterium 10988]